MLYANLIAHNLL